MNGARAWQNCQIKLPSLQSIRLSTFFNALSHDLSLPTIGRDKNCVFLVLPAFTNVTNISCLKLCACKQASHSILRPWALNCATFLVTSYSGCVITTSRFTAYVVISFSFSVYLLKTVFMYTGNSKGCHSESLSQHNTRRSAHQAIHFDSTHWHILYHTHLMMMMMMMMMMMAYNIGPGKIANSLLRGWNETESW
jgi:hypothetical protein